MLYSHRRHAKQKKEEESLNEIRAGFGRINILLKDLDQRLQVVETVLEPGYEPEPPRWAIGCPSGKHANDGRCNCTESDV